MYRVLGMYNSAWDISERTPASLGPIHLFIIPVAGSGKDGFNPDSHSQRLKVPPWKKDFFEKIYKTFVYFVNKFLPSPGLLSRHRVPIRAEQCLDTRQYPPTVEVNTIGSLHQVN